jgi:hypothetical protein
MSEQSLKTTEPRLLKIMTTVLGEFMHPEILVKVSKCSKSAHSIASTTLQRKMWDRQEMSRLIHRLFPGIRCFPNDKELAYYHTLLDAYFAPPPNYDSLSSQVEVSYRIGLSMDTSMDHGTYFTTEKVVPAMRSANGRKMILAAIKDWQAAMMRKPESNVRKTCNLQKLQNLTAIVLTDFAIINNRITSRFERQSVIY